MKVARADESDDKKIVTAIDDPTDQSAEESPLEEKDGSNKTGEGTNSDNNESDDSQPVKKSDIPKVEDNLKDKNGDDKSTKNTKQFTKGFKLRIDQKHAQYMSEKDAHQSTKGQLEKALAEVERLKVSRLANGDDMDDTTDTNENKTLSHDDVERLVAEKMVNMKNDEQKNLFQSELERMSTEFQSILENDYLDKFNQDVGMLDDDAYKEVSVLAQKFKQDPIFWLKQVKANGTKETIAFITGKKKATIEKLLDKKNNIDLETGSKKVIESDIPEVGLDNIMKTLLKKIKK